MIELEGLRKTYDEGRSWAVAGVDLHVEEGELLVLLGESGCGKTTTLKMINRLIEPSAGSVRIDGEQTSGLDPVKLRRRIGYAFQGIGLFPHLTVAENVAVVPSLLRWERAQIGSRVEELLELVHLEPDRYGSRYPEALSGGERQRVGLARALAARPAIMLMDEPLGALDPLTRDALQDEFKSIHEELGLTTILVTHDMIEALLMADRIAVMREGRVVRVDAPHRLLAEAKEEDVRRLMEMPKRQAERIERMIEESEARDA